LLKEFKTIVLNLLLLLIKYLTILLQIKYINFSYILFNANNKSSKCIILIIYYIIVCQLFIFMLQHEPKDLIFLLQERLKTLEIIDPV